MCHEGDTDSAGIEGNRAGTTEACRLLQGEIVVSHRVKVLEIHIILDRFVKDGEACIGSAVRSE